MGQATQVAAYLDKEKPWVSRMEYNALGQETQRLLSNNICSAWDYDKAGRPIFHEVIISEVRQTLLIREFLEMLSAGRIHCAGTDMNRM